MRKILLSLIFFVLFPTALSANETYRYMLDGNGFDSGLGSHKGSVIGNVSPTENRKGEANKAMLFNKGMIVIDGLRNIDFGDKLSISFWMKRDSQNDYMGIINNKSIDIRMGREGLGSFIFANVATSGGSVGVNNMFTIKVGQWEHVVITYDNGRASLYINGSKVHENVINGGKIKPVNAPLIIGTNTRLGYEPFKGALDDIWMFDHVLSESEIGAIYMDTYYPTSSIRIPADFNDQVVPSSGGEIRYGAFINNDSNNIGDDFVLWGIINMPNGVAYPVSDSKSLKINAGSTYEFKNGIINIPEWFPKGNYNLKLYVADPSKPKGNLLFSTVPFLKE